MQVWMMDALWQAVKAHADALVEYLAAKLDAMRLHSSDSGSAQHIEGDIGSQHLDLLHQQVKAARNRVKEISSKAFKQWNRAKADEITRHDDEKGNVATLWNQIRQITRATTNPKKPMIPLQDEAGHIATTTGDTARVWQASAQECSGHARLCTYQQARICSQHDRIIPPPAAGVSLPKTVDEWIDVVMAAITMAKDNKAPRDVLVAVEFMKSLALGLHSTWHKRLHAFKNKDCPCPGARGLSGRASASPSNPCRRLMREGFCAHNTCRKSTPE